MITALFMIGVVFHFATSSFEIALESLYWRAPQTQKVSLKQVRTAITGDEGVTDIVFRAHEKANRSE